jgi:hypothetical protein
MEELIIFDFKIEYREGKKNPINGLSRRPDLWDRGKLDTAKRTPFRTILKRFPKGYYLSLLTLSKALSLNSISLATIVG